MAQRFDPLGVPAVATVVGEVERLFAGEGRVVLRASGTELVIRVMVEAREEQTARAAAERIAGAVQSVGS